MCPLCAILGVSSEFEVEVDETRNILDLKQAIKAENKNTLANHDAIVLTLYKTSLDISNDDNYTKIMDEISKGGDNLNKQKLIPSRKISTFFGGDSDGVIQVLVELPPGEPIDPRACGNVVPMAHVRQLDAPFHSRTPRHVHG